MWEVERSKRKRTWCYEIISTYIRQRYQIYASGVLSLSTPMSLQFKVFFELSLHFGRRGREGLRELSKNDIHFVKDSDGAFLQPSPSIHMRKTIKVWIPKKSVTINICIIQTLKTILTTLSNCTCLNCILNVRPFFKGLKWKSNMKMRIGIATKLWEKTLLAILCQWSQKLLIFKQSIPTIQFVQPRSLRYKMQVHWS